MKKLVHMDTFEKLPRYLGMRKYYSTTESEESSVATYTVLICRLV